jgi:hypothetical protein
VFQPKTRGETIFHEDASMRTPLFRLACRSVSICMMIFAAFTVPVLADSTEMVSYAPAYNNTAVGVSLGGPNAQNQSGKISRDGRYVVFLSTSSLLPGYRAGVSQIYVKDRKSNTISLVSRDHVNPSIGGEWNSSAPSISGDGRFVSFDTASQNMIDSGVPIAYSVYVWDRDFDENGIFDELNGTETKNKMYLVSVGLDGTLPNNTSYGAEISRDGRWVAFYSWASNLVPEGGGSSGTVYVRELKWNNGGTTVKVGVKSDGTQPTGGSVYAPSISGNGRHVVFGSAAGDLPGANGNEQVYVHDRDADGDGILDETHDGGRSTSLVSFNPSTGAAANNYSGVASIDEEGRYVTFITRATNLLSGVGDGNGYDLLLHDRDDDNDGVFDETPSAGNSTVQVNVDSAGNKDNRWGGVMNHSISADGRFVAFETDGTNIDPSGYPGAFVRDRDSDGDGVFDETHAGACLTYLVSKTNSGLPISYAWVPAISGDGKVVAFLTSATNVVTSPTDTNGVEDLYVRVFSGITITKATFDYLLDRLVVNATSALGSADALFLEEFGVMTWAGSSKNYWEKTVNNVAVAPTVITVTGKKGSATVQ